MTFIFFVAAFVSPAVCVAQEGAWNPPAPSSQERDWLHLTSGEWLWGTIELMRDESLEFDSEELDVVTIEWASISEIRSARIMTYVLLDGSMVTGTSTLVARRFASAVPPESGKSPGDRSRPFSQAAPPSSISGRPRLAQT